MAERGLYRSIPVVLFDGPDFQRLSGVARAVFLCLKCSIRVHGLEVQYRAALVPVLAYRTGFAVPDVERALDELLSARPRPWIRWQGNVLWVIGQLEHDPHVNVANEKNRIGVREHLKGMPRVPIVAEFIRAHVDWVRVGHGKDWLGTPVDPALQWAFDAPPDGIDTPSEGPSEADRRPMEGPSEADRTPIEAIREREVGRERERGEEQERDAPAAPSRSLTRSSSAPVGEPASPTGLTVIRGTPKPARRRLSLTGRPADDVIGALQILMSEVKQDADDRITVDEHRKLIAAFVFAYWAKKLNHDNARLDEKRERVLVKRLVENGDDVNELLYVVDGALRDDWIMGRDARSPKRYDGIETVFRDRAQVERLALAGGFRSGQRHALAERYEQLLTQHREAANG